MRCYVAAASRTRASAILRHAGTTHHDHMRAVLFDQPLTSGNQSVACSRRVSQLGDLKTYG
jgi:hypothetical protein